MSLVLVVEDHEPSLEALATLVEEEGHQVWRATNLGAARQVLEDNDIQLVLCDLSLPDGKGLELLDTEGRSFDLVLVTGEATVESAVSALRLGAADYLTKPLDLGRLRALLTQFQRTNRLRLEVSSLREELEEVGRLGALIGASEAMKNVYRLVRRVAETDATVLITGESGTGKEVVAQTLHDLSTRCNKALLPLNCGAVSPTLIESELFGHERGSFTGADRKHEGHFERAHDGTLFLDEITEMPLELQVKLLRVLETGNFLRVGGTKPVEVDVRILAASNRDPKEAIEQKTLREDLYYRLRVFPIHLPPLRDRRGDVELLSRHFVAQMAQQQGTDLKISDEALGVLESYSWPGNVRELKNVLARAAILSDGKIQTSDLPPEVRSGESLVLDGAYLRISVGSSLEDAERRLILATLAEMDGKRKETADVLGVSQKTLYNRLKSYEAEKA